MRPSILVVAIGIVTLGLPVSSWLTVQDGPTAHAVASAAIPSAWTYSTTKDQLTGGDIYSATLVSTNTVRFSFPYEGSQHGFIRLRRHPRFGEDAIIAVERGQFVCGTDCQVSVRFDEEFVHSWDMVRAADGRSDLLFFYAGDAFIGKLKESAVATVAATFFQEGERVFTFKVSGVKW
jgi:hypothetical protein